MIRCLAIDDEKLALELLEDNIRKVPSLFLVRGCRNAMEALEVMQEEKIDLIFLDIQMPDVSGIQFLKSLEEKPVIIFTTAFEKFALEGFELDAVDYLLKPFSFERFLKAVNKATELIHSRELTGQESPFHPQEPVADYFFVKSDYKQIRINLNEILYIEALKDYVKIVTGEQTVVTQMSMKSIEEKLSPRLFARVHRSFIIAVGKIEFIHRDFIRIAGKDIPFSEHYKEILDQIINGINH